MLVSIKCDLNKLFWIDWEHGKAWLFPEVISNNKIILELSPITITYPFSKKETIAKTKRRFYHEKKIFIAEKNFKLKRIIYNGNITNKHVLITCNDLKNL